MRNKASLFYFIARAKGITFEKKSMKKLLFLIAVIYITGSLQAQQSVADSGFQARRLPKKLTPFYTSSSRQQKKYKDLFNGKDLEGWTIFLKDKPLNSDDEHNFLMEDDVLHVRGKELGYIRTKDSFTNYHFVVEFKWGDKKWPPREGAKRDAGICYNIPASEPDSIWPQSIECQIQEGDVGDFWLLGFCTITVNDSTNKPTNHTRMVKSKDGEKPTGEWNTVEVISYKGRCIHIVNGIVVNEGEKASVANGGILLQSEYSEVYYRHPRMKLL